MICCFHHSAGQQHLHQRLCFQATHYECVVLYATSLQLLCVPYVQAPSTMKRIVLAAACMLLLAASGKRSLRVGAAFYLLAAVAAACAATCFRLLQCCVCIV
jgi:hypothetical protein